MPDDREYYGKPEFLGWYLLVRLKERSDEQISRSKFLKLCCIADRYLLEELDYDVGLPRYWYMYGELANQHEFEGRFFNAPTAVGWEGQQYLPKRTLDVDDFDVSRDDVRTINAGVEWTLQNHGGKDVEGLKRHQYSEQAPNTFIQTYSELRWLLQNIDLGSQQRLDTYGDEFESNAEYVNSLLDEMVAAYPTDEPRYEGMHSLYLRWDDTIRLSLEQSPDFGAIEESLDEFIYTLSQVVLRFNYNRNISEERLDDWEADAAEQKAQFATSLREQRQDLLRERDRSDELDGVSESYSKSVAEDISRILTGD